MWLGSVKEKNDFAGGLDAHICGTSDHLDALIAFPQSIVNSSITLCSIVYKLVSLCINSAPHADTQT